jgi:hypothetical protein
VLEAVELKQKTRTIRLGKARAEKILAILHYKEGGSSAVTITATVAPAIASQRASRSRLIPAEKVAKPRAKNVAHVSLDDAYDTVEGVTTAATTAISETAPDSDILAEITEEDLALLLDL